MSNAKSLIYLLRQYADDIATTGELEQLKNILNNTGHNEETITALAAIMEETDSLQDYNEERLQAIWKKIKQPETQRGEKAYLNKLSGFNKKSHWWAAAAILILISSLTFLFVSRQPQKAGVVTATTRQLKNGLAPGGDKAVLTLSDGSTIVLDSAQNGTLALQGGTSILKMNSGQLAYNTANGSTTEILYNTLTTPLGGQYKLLLPDGTSVWLNAASSITYPTAFKGMERNVTITGEAYFEVAHLTTGDGKGSIPFIVKISTPSGDVGQVEVLGTHFNINAYGDEPDIKATLLEGSIRLNNNSAASLLKPGQQGRINKAGKIDLIENANTEEAVAWKNGIFYFDNADIKKVMRQIARWYDVEVVFKENITSAKFVGEIPRNSNIMEVFKILELSNVHFKLEDKKIIVLP